MIRRDDRGDWLVIAQIEHARLAGELAQAWGNALVAQFAANPSLLFGVARHDDGWKKWDAAPRINPANGIPRSFLEMRMRDSTAIWTRSIAVCSCEPLAGIAVSRHFCYLARQAQTSPRLDADDRQSLDRFLQEQGEAEAGLVNAASSPYATDHDKFREACDLGFRTVRFFDGLSLWLCCAGREQPETFTAPLGDAVTIIPKEATHLALDPYPFQVDALEIETPARRLAARPYADDAELQAALRAAPIETLAWTLVPA